MLFFLLGGFMLVFVASAIEGFCAFGRSARDDVKPGILKTPIRWVIEAAWVIFLIAGSALLVLTGVWIFPLVGVLSFWILLPFIITPILRYRLLPHWDEVKHELEPKGLTQKNYWREDWWMIPSKQKVNKKKTE
jgi:fatty acid desaturase